MPRPLPRRGVIEGFYGRPWTPEERTDAIRFLAEVGMNAYVYAPKDDPLHRSEWRTAYTGAARTGLETLARTAAECGVDAGFAISPGLDLDPSDPGEAAALRAKVHAAAALGFPWIVLAFDDIPVTPSSAADQLRLVASLLADLPEGVHEVTVVPTEYVGTVGSPYLAELTAGLDPAVGLMWTGPTVCSPVVDAEAARAWSTAVGGRSTLLWDNTPVNDGSMAGALHLGPYLGRPADLSDHIDGILLNPMNQASLSRVVLAAAAEYCTDPSRYDPDAAWSRAIDRVDDHRGVLGPIARALAAGPTVPISQLPLGVLVDDLEAGSPSARDAVARELRDLRTATTEVRRLAGSGDPIGLEVEPWCDAIDREVVCGLAALRLLAHLDAGSEEALLAAAFGLAWSWTAALEDGRRRVFGGRAVLHPAVVRLADGRSALDPGSAVRVGDTPIDRLARIALDRYADRYDLRRVGVSA